MKVIYQIYPLSFKDTNNDGIGDIGGVIEKLPYLKELGVDYIWLTPICESPMIDNGYDISDYYKINPIFGSNEDFLKLLNGAKKLNMDIIVDLVLNHTSSEHAWFKESRKSKDNPFRNYYIWQEEPNDITSTFSGNAWTKDEITNEYYFHLFAKEQPDLNWQNPDVRKEMYKMINYYIDLGVKGFRLDVLDLIGKDVKSKQLSNGPFLLEYLEELYENCFKGKDIYTVAEMGIPLEVSKIITEKGYLTSIFQFDHIILDEVKGKGKWELRKLQLSELKKIFNNYQSNPAVIPLFWSNHDQPRALGRYLNLDYRYYGQTMLFTLLYLQRGHIYIYQGEEFGMSGLGYQPIDVYKDVESINFYNHSTKPIKDRLRSLEVKSRDHSRTPMQWDNSLNAGFSTNNPWIIVNPNYKEVNCLKDLNSENSIYHFLQKLIKLKKTSKTLSQGNFEMLLWENEDIFAYKRTLDETYIVVVNFKDRCVAHNLNFENYKIILNNYKTLTQTLNPYQAVVLKKIK